MSQDVCQDTGDLITPAAHHPHVQRVLGEAAHDLNNTVGAIANIADFLAEDIEESDPRHADAASIVLALSAGVKTASVEVDPARCSEVVMALLSNAREAGGAAARIDVSADVQRASDPCVMIAVHDSGSGLPGDVRTDPFAPLTRRADGGRPSSLARAAGFAAQCGGTISIQTAPNDGATVLLTLPLAPRTGGGAP